MSEVQFILDPGELMALGELMPGEPGRLSPMRPGKKLSPEQITMLRKKGIIDAGGKVAHAFRPALETMACAGYFARARLSGASSYLESMVYYSNDYKHSVALLTLNEGILVQYPAPVKDIVLALKEYIGESSLQNLEFQAETSFEEALALAALIDLQRRASLRALAEDREPDEGGFAIEVIYQETVKENDNALWLVTLLGEMTGIKMQRPALEQALRGLVTDGLIISKNGGYHLAGQARGVADQFMIINNILSLKSGRELTGGEVAQVGFICVQSGVTGIMTLETSENNLVQLTTMPSRALFRYVELYLSDPVAIQMLIPDEKIEADTTGPPLVEPAQKAAEVNCPACRRINDPKAVFCISCGTKMVQESLHKPEITCGKCGMLLKPESRFCSQCGSQVSL